jgi:hypothetical protein
MDGTSSKPKSGLEEKGYVRVLPDRHEEPASSQQETTDKIG